MIWNSVSVLIVLSVCGIVVSSPERPVDCRKFVFAPLCRGVAAKRGTSDSHAVTPSAIFMNPKIFEAFLKNFFVDAGLLRAVAENEDDKASHPRKLQRQRDDSVYTFLQEARGGGGGSSNSGGGDAENRLGIHDYENL